MTNSMHARRSSANPARAVALVYARKSVVKDKRDEVSPERQVALCSDVAREHGWHIEAFVDAAGHRSGGSEQHRPEWRRLKLQLARADVASVIVGDITRASRSPKDFFLFLDECSRRGVQFIAIRDNIDTTTANGRVMLGILIALAAWEREIASERAAVAINYKRDQGKHVGNAPFGTKRDENGVLVESDDWTTCRVVFEQYATGMFSFYRLAARLNAEGLRFRNRQREPVPFDRSSVRSIVSNVLTYAGYIVRGHGKDMSLPYDLDLSGDVIQAYAQHVGAIEGQHTPLLARDLAARIIHVRKTSMQPRRDFERKVYILYPLLHCAVCGSEMRGMRKRERSNYVHRGKVCVPRQPALDAEEIERRVLARLVGLRLSPEQRDDLKRRVEDKLSTAPEHADTLSAIHNLEVKLERLKTLYVEGDISKEQYDQQKHVSNNALEELRAKLGPRTASLDAVFEQLDSIAGILMHGSAQQQRRALGDIYERIEVDPSGHITAMLPRAWVMDVFRDLAHLKMRA